MLQSEQFNLGFYFKSLSKLTGSPRKFFQEYPTNEKLKKPLGFLIVSSLLYAAASLIVRDHLRPYLMGAVFFINGIGMVLIFSAIGYMAMRLTTGNIVGFSRFFSIYAFSSGTTLLLGWLPVLTLPVEFWKCYMIGIGMISTLGLKLKQVFIILGLSYSVLILCTWTILAMISK